MPLKRAKTEFNVEKADFIVGLFKTDFFKVAEVCKIAGISRSAFYKWVNRYPSFKERIEDAKMELASRTELRARNGLLKRLAGFTVTERKVITKPGNERDADNNPIPVVKAIEERTRYVPADTKAIIFVLTNLDPKHWNRANRVEVVKSSYDDKFASLTDEELQAVIDRLSAQLNESKSCGSICGESTTE